MYAVLHPGMVLVLPRAGEKPHAAMPLTPGATASGSSSVPAVSTTTSTNVAASPSSPATAPTSSFEQCVIARESGGNADATNGGGYWGLFQFSPSTWAAYGGDPAAFGNASAGEQEQVFNNAMARGGESNWAPYDGC
jgi:hypothetical protein